MAIFFSGNTPRLYLLSLLRQEGLTDAQKLNTRKNNGPLMKPAWRMIILMAIELERLFGYDRYANQQNVNASCRP